jgi:hypothetical protein
VECQCVVVLPCHAHLTDEKKCLPHTFAS